jgi:hypothetical protein
MSAPTNIVFKQYAPGAKTPFVSLAPIPILAKKAPLGNNNAEQGTMWIELENNVNALVNGIWINTGKYAGVNQWVNLTGGNGNFQNINLPYTTASVGRFTYDNILTFNVPNETNIFVGQAAGNVGVAGASNTSLGTLTLSAVTSGGSNLALGYSSLEQVTTGSTNVAVGPLALSALTSGASNLALGGSALLNLLTGSTNIAIGPSAGTAYVLAESGNVVINDPGTVGDANMLRITSNGAAQISTTGSTNGLLLQTNGLVEVSAVLTTAASPSAGTTANQRLVRMAYTGFVTAAAGTQSFTFTSSFINVASMVFATVTNLNASGNGAFMGLQGIQQASGSMVIHTINNGAAALGAGDTVFVNVWIID